MPPQKPSSPAPRLGPNAAVLLLSAASALLLALTRETSLYPFSFASTLVLFATPGVLATLWFFADEVSGPSVVPVGFALSVGLFGLIGVPYLILHASIEAYLWTCGAVLAAFLVAAAYRAARRSEVSMERRVQPAPGAGWLWAPFVALGTVLVVISTRRVPSGGDDIWVYLSWTRQFSVAQNLAVVDPYFGRELPQLSRALVNGWLLLQAGLVRVTGIDVLELVLRYLTPALVAVALIGVYALARALLQDERTAVVCGCVYALFHLVFIQPSVHNIGAELVARIPEDKHAARFIILPVALIAAALYARTRKWRYLGLFAFMSWAMISVHPIVLPALGLCMLGFGLAHVAAHPRRLSAWACMTALALAMWSVVLGPVLLLFAGRSPADVLYSADINSTPPKVLANLVFVKEEWRHIYRFEDGSYIMHPWLILNPVILASLVLGVPFLVRRVRNSIAAQVLLGGLVVTTVAVYVPPVATFIGENLIIPGQLWRLAWPIPLLSLITAGWMLAEAAPRIQTHVAARLGRRRTRRLLIATGTVAALAALAYPAYTGVVLLRDGEAASDAGYDPDPIYPWIQSHVDEPSLIFAPDEANTALPAYSSLVDVVSLRGGSIIRDRKELERSAGSKIPIPEPYLDVYRFYEKAKPKEQRAILRRYRPDYLMLPTEGDLQERFRRDPALTPVDGAPQERYALYRVDGDKLGE